MVAPNIVLLHCHDLGRHLGCYGVPTVSTPHIDALAADGVRFDAAFCTAPQCSPSRAAMFTGRYPHATGVLGLTHGQFGWDLDPGTAHVARLLSDAGYRTELVGVHHESRMAEDRLVAVDLGFGHVDSGGLANSVTDRAVQRLTMLARQDLPFYLQVGYVEPHRLPRRGERDYQGFLGNHVEPDDSLGVTVPPYLIDDASARSEIAELQGAIKHVDAAVGRVLSAIHDLDLDESTIVVFTTDHGLALPRAKCALYDPGIEVALIVRYPARGWIGGRTVPDLVSNVDVTPTLLDAVNVSPPGNLHGRSMCGLLDDEPGASGSGETFSELTYHSYYDPRRCVRTQAHKLIVNFSSAPAAMEPSDSRRPRCTPRVPVSGPGASHSALELYDLTADPYEFHNVAQDGRYATVRRDLLKRLKQWMYATDDPLLCGPVANPIHAQSISALADA